MTGHAQYIDAHHHLWDLQAVNYPWLNEKGIVRFFGDPSKIQRSYLLTEHQESAIAHGVGGSVHIQVGAENGLDEARWIDSLATDNPNWPLVQVAFADLTSDFLNQELDALQKLKSVRGVRQIIGRAPKEDQQTGTQQLITQPAFSYGLRELTRRGLRFDLQLIPEVMAATAEVLQDHPDLSVALCHAGSPHDRSAAGIKAWQEALQSLSRLPNVYCKLSGLGMFQHHWQTSDFAPIVGTCLEQFGAKRCMFGSNFPVDSLYSNYQRLFDAFYTLVPETEHAQLFAATARRFYDF